MMKTEAKTSLFKDFIFVFSIIIFLSCVFLGLSFVVYKVYFAKKSPDSSAEKTQAAAQDQPQTTTAAPPAEAAPSDAQPALFASKATFPDNYAGGPPSGDDVKKFKPRTSPEELKRRFEAAGFKMNFQAPLAKVPSPEDIAKRAREAMEGKSEEPPAQTAEQPSSPTDQPAPEETAEAAQTAEAVPEEESTEAAAEKTAADESAGTAPDKKDQVTERPAPVERMIHIVHLRNGRQLEGDLKEKDADTIDIENEGTAMEIKRSEIDNIEYIPHSEWLKRNDISKMIVTKELMSGQEVVVTTYDNKVIQGTISTITNEELSLLMKKGILQMKRSNIKAIDRL